MDRRAEARWTGDLKGGKGSIEVGSGAVKVPYSFVSRFETSADTNPEELIGAALAACYSMALAAALARGGHVATSVTTNATVHITKSDAGWSISRIDLATRGVVPGVPAEEFNRLAEETKSGCIVSRALGAVPKTLDAQLVTA